MYGLIGKFTAAPGKRDELLSALTDGSEPMPGCLSYIIATDPSDENTIWITEVWDNKENHQASLNIPLGAGSHRQSHAAHRRHGTGSRDGPG